MPEKRGLRFLAERVVRSNRVIRRLYLDRCLVTDEAAIALVVAIQTRTAGGELELMRISPSFCSEVGEKVLQQAGGCNGVLMLCRE